VNNINGNALSGYQESNLGELGGDNLVHSLSMHWQWPVWIAVSGERQGSHRIENRATYLVNGLSSKGGIPKYDTVRLAPPSHTHTVTLTSSAINLILILVPPAHTHTQRT
jgi:hypothetical protein